MKRYSTWLLVLALLVVVTLTSTAGAVPRLVNYQGALSDDRALPVTGRQMLTFTFYSGRGVAATPLWTEVHDDVDVRDGLFHVMLGSVTPLTDDVLALEDLWVGVRVGHDVEMKPRMQLAAVPWAIRAAVADAVVGGANVAWPEATPPELSERERMSRAESEMLRSDFLGICDLYEELGVLTGNDVLLMVADNARGEFEYMSWEELSIFGDAREPVADLRDALIELNAMAFSQAAGGGGESGGPLTPGFPDADYWPLYGSERNNPDAMFWARLGLKTAQGLWSGLSRLCGQTIAGFNTNVVCIPVDWVLFGAEEVFAQFCEKDSDIDSAEIEASYERLGHLHVDIELVQATSDSTLFLVEGIDERLEIVEAKIDILTEMVEDLNATNCEIIRLLHTPQGQRTSDVLPCEGEPGYPYDWPAGTP